VLSIWAETFSHTVTESWSVGVPVLGSALGAVGARIERHGGGWIIDTSEPEAAYREILAALDDHTGWEITRREASVDGHPSLSDMAGRYLELYDRILDQRRVLAPS
jgi:glycosyltransferase involved in cell wall biosynthesis